MSLINQMLRDLDERNAPPVDRAGLPPAIHALPPEQRQSWLPALAGVAVLVAGVAWYGMMERAESPAPTPEVVPVAPPAPLPTKEDAPPAVRQEPEPVVQEPAPIPLQDVPPLPRIAAVEEPRLPAIAPTPAVSPVAKTKASTSTGSKSDVPAAAGKTRVASNSNAEDSKKEVAPVATAAAPKEPVGSASIDKRPRTSLPNEAADAEYRKAMSAVRRGAGAEAIEGLRTALKLDAMHVSARQALLSLLVEQQHLDEARSLLEEGLSLDPAQTGWAMALARLQLEGGKLADATDTLVRYGRYADQNAEYQAFMGLLLQKQRRGKEAVDRYRAALALRPAESRWWYGLGLVLEAEQRQQEAREAFLKARETGNLSPELAAAVDQKLR